LKPQGDLASKIADHGVGHELSVFPLVFGRDHLLIDCHAVMLTKAEDDCNRPRDDPHVSSRHARCRNDANGLPWIATLCSTRNAFASLAEFAKMPERDMKKALLIVVVLVGVPVLYFIYVIAAIEYGFHQNRAARDAVVNAVSVQYPEARCTGRYGYEHAIILVRAASIKDRDNQAEMLNWLAAVRASYGSDMEIKVRFDDRDFDEHDTIVP
jgi:hypothetical protein